MPLRARNIRRLALIANRFDWLLVSNTRPAMATAMRVSFAPRQDFKSPHFNAFAKAGRVEAGVPNRKRGGDANYLNHRH